MKIQQIVGIENIDFLHHTRNYLSADFFLVGINFITIPILTRLLTPDAYGILAVFTALLSMATVMMGFNLHTGIKRYYFERPDSFPQALGTNLLFLAVCSLIILVGLSIHKSFLATFFNIDQQLFMQVIVVAFLTIPLQILLSYLQAVKNSKQNSMLSIIKTMSTLTLTIVLIMNLTENKYMGRIYSELAVCSCFFIYASYSLYRIGIFTSISKKYVTYTLGFALPLIPHTIAGFVLSYFDRIIIQQLSTTTNSGLYSFAYNVGMLMNIVVMSSAKAWQPIFLAEIKQGNYQKINSIAHTYSNYIYCAAIALILFSREIVMLLADHKYYDALNIVPIIVISYVFVFWHTLYFQYAAHRKKTALLSMNTIIAGVCNVALNYWLIPRYGYVMAAYNTLLSYLLLSSLHYLNARVVLRERVIPLGIILPRFLIVLLVFAVNALFLHQIEHYIVVFLLKMAMLTFFAHYFIIRKSDVTKDEVS